MDSNHGPLESKATALPTEPQPLPDQMYLFINLVFVDSFFYIWDLSYKYF